MNVETLTTIARKKAQGSAALERQWMLALQRLASSGVSEAVLSKIAVAGASPSAISRLAKLLSGNAEESASLLFANCDASRHGLDEWIDAIDALYAWLEKRGRHEKLAKSIGFISCASEGSPDARLAWVVVQMLDQYGMDR